MTLTAEPQSHRVAPDQVHDHLKQHILADGFQVVLDLEKSHGSYLYDSLRGRHLLDLFTCFSTCPLGYNHPKVNTPEFRERILPSAINKPSNSDMYTTEMAEFVDALSRTIPAPLNERLFFIEGGALAVENAMKTAFDWKVRKNRAAGRPDGGNQIIHFREAFHGRTGYTMSVTNTDPAKTDFFPQFPWPRISNPKLSFPTTDDVLASVIEAEKVAIGEIKQAITDHGHNIAGLLLEPIQGEGGDNHFRTEFLQALRDLADEHQFLLLFDEVQTGFATTGRWWCFENYGVMPDVFSFGKKTQVCGIAAGPRVDEVDSVFKVSSRINSTWGGNLVDMVRCTRYVEVIEEDNLLDNARDVGGYLLERIRGLEEQFPGKVTNGRGLGMFLAFDLPSAEARSGALDAMMKSDVLGLASGTRSIRFRPPVSLTRDEVDDGLTRIEAALKTVL